MSGLLLLEEEDLDERGESEAVPKTSGSILEKVSYTGLRFFLLSELQGLPSAGVHVSRESRLMMTLWYLKNSQSSFGGKKATST